MEFYPHHCRRHSASTPLSYHMGFYEQNLPNSQQRTWKLYEHTNKVVLTSLKPILKILSEHFSKFLKSLPCPPKFGLFGTIFTTIVVNFSSCQWHVDPTDKFAVLMYFGNFSEGFLSVGPPINMKIPVTAFDCAWLASGEVFHKGDEFLGNRINISCYCKKTTEHTAKGKLTVDPAAMWALRK
jgi:hypothetical protein